MTKLIFITILVMCGLSWSLSKTILILEDFMVIMMCRLGGMSQCNTNTASLLWQSLLIINFFISANFCNKIKMKLCFWCILDDLFLSLSLFTHAAQVWAMLGKVSPLRRILRLLIRDDSPCHRECFFFFLFFPQADYHQSCPCKWQGDLKGYHFLLKYVRA